jgi:hypothetical protein
MCFVFIWEQTATCATYSINWLVFITEMKSVYCAIRTGYLNKTVWASYLKGELSLTSWDVFDDTLSHNMRLLSKSLMWGVFRKEGKSVPFLLTDYSNTFYNYSEHLLSSMFSINTQFGGADLSSSAGWHPSQSGRSCVRIIKTGTKVTEGLFFQRSGWKERPWG